MHDASFCIEIWILPLEALHIRYQCDIAQGGSTTNCNRLLLVPKHIRKFTRIYPSSERMSTDRQTDGRTDRPRQLGGVEPVLVWNEWRRLDASDCYWRCSADWRATFERRHPRRTHSAPDRRTVPERGSHDQSVFRCTAALRQAETSLSTIPHTEFRADTKEKAGEKTVKDYS